MKNKIIWLNYFRPTLFVQNINDINLFSIKKSGIRYIFCDLDNTLIPHFSTFPNKHSFAFISELKKLGFKIIIISNNKKSRVETFCNLVDVDDFIYNAKKPLVKKIKKIIEKHDIPIDDIIFIGDQFITDIWVANRLNIKSILVLPLVELSKEGIKNFVVYLLEHLIYKNLSLNNQTNNLNDDSLKVEYDLI